MPRWRRPPSKGPGTRTPSGMQPQRRRCRIRTNWACTRLSVATVAAGVVVDRAAAHRAPHGDARPRRSKRLVPERSLGAHATADTREISAVCRSWVVRCPRVKSYFCEDWLCKPKRKQSHHPKCPRTVPASPAQHESRLSSRLTVPIIQKWMARDRIPCAALPPGRTWAPGIGDGGRHHHLKTNPNR